MQVNKTLKKKTDIQLINEQIKAFKIRVISTEGENLGLLTRDRALELARESDLDLVVLSETDGIPLAKIMDFGKSLYNKKKKMSESKKKQKVVKVKEVKMRPKIGEHDYMTKINQGVKFLNSGHKLKVTIMFRGRGMATKEPVGAEFFNKIDGTFQELGLKSLAHEKDVKSGPFWSRIYFVKTKK